MSVEECRVVPVQMVPHPNADNLALVYIDGYQVVVNKKDFDGVDRAVFIPPDYVVPDTERWKWLGGSRRIKTRKFRGERSEGLLVPAEAHMPVGYNAIMEMGITKWESPSDKRWTPRKQPVFNWWNPRHWYYRVLRWNDRRVSKKAAPPQNVHKYDIEGGKRFNVLIDGEIVVITEKIHGANARFVYSTKSKQFHIGSHTQWKRKGDADWWNHAVEQNPWIEALCRRYPDCVFYGEVYGGSVQRLDYGMGTGEFGLRLFDIYELGIGWASWERLANYYFHDNMVEDHWVPRIYKGPWSPDLISTAEGNTKLGGKHIREGAVVEPWVARVSPGLGRVKVKYINPAYYEIEE